MATEMSLFLSVYFQNGSLANEESQNQQGFNIIFYKMADLINKKCLLGTLCFGEESQTLRVGKNMIIVMRLIPYDARSIYYIINRY